jgi:HSP20 family protein
VPGAVPRHIADVARIGPCRATSRFTDDQIAILEKLNRADRDHLDPFWPSFKWPAFRGLTQPIVDAWAPKIDVFEKDNRLFTRIDLPGVKKEDVKVEVTDGRLALTGERKQEKEEKKDNVYRTECEYGSFYREVPLPEGVKLEDVKATFADGVLEVSVPLPARPEAKVRKVEIQEPAKATKTAA